MIVDDNHLTADCVLFPFDFDLSLNSLFSYILMLFKFFFMSLLNIQCPRVHHILLRLINEFLWNYLCLLIVQKINFPEWKLNIEDVVAFNPPLLLELKASLWFIINLNMFIILSIFLELQDNPYRLLSTIFLSSR